MILVVATQMVLEFLPLLLGEVSNLANVFQMGWNRQLVISLDLGGFITLFHVFLFDLSNLSEKLSRVVS